ncbi:metalloregulator ArsR/SmtB family transcription factor [Chloroflexus aggregans]|uniref:Transcriptional regulator, ArsR family n=1 Tax=Chloroflexus aggregans (strain MD-66 / DSM 9485) TaxID=326427 RepID=B8G408_CHLAD|nr:metalloregulator ArsR/SmtB family transcription factor [Chloroflexus aggregans]ACL25410.1 transcriptional regulator, ArsR family [Chloroflexus aggregans DSM 9485]
MKTPNLSSAFTGLRLLADETRWKLISELRESDRQVAELVARTGLAQNLVSYHLHVLRQSELVNTHRSDADGRVVYYSLSLTALARLLAQVSEELAIPTTPPPSLPHVKVAFLCRANSARSQMAEGWLRVLSNGQVVALSAGTHPQPVHPLAIAVMQEAGVPIDRHVAKPIDAILNQKPDVIVTVCDIARETCPVWPEATRSIHWSIADPAAVVGSEEECRAAFVAARDTIHERVRGLLALLPRWFADQSPSAVR